MRANRPMGSGSSGRSSDKPRARRIASATRSPRMSCPWDVAQVTFVEHQIQDAENGVEARRERWAIRDLVRDAGARDLLLRSSDALSDRRFGDKECSRDFRDAEPPKRAQSQCNLGLAREGRVAAGEDQPQLIVGNRRELELILRTMHFLIEAE